MDSRSQIRQRDPVHLGQGNFDRRAGGQGCEILEDPLQQIMVFPAPIPSEIRDHHAVIVQSRSLILCIVLWHTIEIPQRYL